jgi:hypothetical protein
MQDDNRDYIIQPTPVVDDGSYSGTVDVFLVLFALCVLGVFLNWAWDGIEPFYLAVMDWRNGVVGWFQGVFG